MPPESDVAGVDVVPAALVAQLEHLRGRAATYAGKARAEATKKAYRTDWAEFTAWAHHKGLATLPAEPLTVICYIVELAGAAKTSTIARRLVSIGEYHRAARCPSPADDVELQAVWAGIRHEHGTAPDVAEPISVVLLRAMIARLPPTARGKRDQALLLVGFAAALRRSELVALDRADIAERREGLVVNVRRSKTDQEGAGRRVGVPYGSTPATCPVRALEAWCQAARIEEGPLFVTFDRRGRITPTPRRSTGSCSAQWQPRGSRRPATRPTRCGPAWPPRQRLLASRSGRSWSRPATAASPWPGATSGKGRCSERTRLRPLGCSSDDRPSTLR
jgi:integrase